jgi:hypothetical protein
LIEKTVCSGLVTCWCFAIWPTNRSPLSVKPTTDGVSREPDELINTFGVLPSITETTEFVVPKSIPIILFVAIFSSFSFYRLLVMSNYLYLKSANAVPKAIHLTI